MLKAAEAESRDFMSSERDRWDVLMSEIDGIDQNIKRATATRPEWARNIHNTNAGEQHMTQHKAGEWIANELRALVGSGTTGGGSYTPAEASRTFFDLLAAESVALRSGMNQIRTDKDSLVIPRLTGDVGSAWVAEAAAIPQTSLTADQVTATPRKLGALEQLSNEVISDSDPAILDVVGRSIVRSLGLKLDLGAFEGSGTPPEIRGLKNVSGIGTVSMGANGAALANLDVFADAISTVLEAGGNPSAIVAHPRTWRSILKLKEQTSGNNKPLISVEQGGVGEAPRLSLYGLPVYLSKQLSITETQGTASNASSAYVYDASQAFVVMRNDVRVERDSSRLFNSDQSEVRGLMRADFVVAQAAAVVRILGIIP